MLFEVMKHCKNFFTTGKHVYEVFKIEDGTVLLPFLQNGQFYLIEGSVFNDGVHQYPSSDLKDEVFYGCITPLRIPKAFLDLVKEIETWQKTNGSKAESMFQSESFGGYSYTKATGKNGGSFTWKDAFSSRLAEWRKI